MNAIEAINLIDIAWEEKLLIAGIYPCRNKGYVAFRNDVFNTLKEREILI